MLINQTYTPQAFQGPRGEALNETPKDKHQKLSLFWTISYYVYYGMLVGCSGDSKGETAEHVRRGERFCFEGRVVDSSIFCQISLIKWSW